ncbi:MAG: rhomboid family intramembrane serine protease [Lachnospiraceae bacterium]|nr:rhomboid family intramembrane serine protease [Lachnospiraceae bacterium]
MGKLLDKLERKFGRYAITNMIKYVIIIYVAGAIMGILNPKIYYTFLSLDMGKIMQGQVWRLFTYLLEPSGLADARSGGGISPTFLFTVIFFVFKVYLFFMFGTALEREWGAFRFNVYLVSGWLLNIVAALILFLCPAHVTTYYMGFEYIYWAMFFAFAMFYPNMQLLLMGFIPVKVKWLAILDAVYLIYEIIQYTSVAIYAYSHSQPDSGAAYLSCAIAIVVAMLNFLIYFFSSAFVKSRSPRAVKRRKKFEKKTTIDPNMPRHRCAICGRTEKSNPELEFRFCSKCNGNYEYCSEHLFTHKHM